MNELASYEHQFDFPYGEGYRHLVLPHAKIEEATPSAPGLYSWHFRMPRVELPASIDTHALHERALDIGLGLAPGVMFSAGNGCRNAVRINCGIAWSDEAEKAYAIYGRLLRRASGDQAVLE